MDYFPDDFLLVVDESHVSRPQVGAMFRGDRSRKVNLVDFGSSTERGRQRPLMFDEFLERIHQAIYVSATPGDWELEQTEGVIVEQVVPDRLGRPDHRAAACGRPSR